MSGAAPEGTGPTGAGYNFRPSLVHPPWFCTRLRILCSFVFPFYFTLVSPIKRGDASWPLAGTRPALWPYDAACKTGFAPISLLHLSTIVYYVGLSWLTDADSSSLY